MNAKTSKICNVCQSRPQYSGKSDETAPRHSEMCNPCFTEGGHENAHNDSNHENDATPTPGCWICFPELNLAQNTYIPRSGTSRVGMVINVPLKASGAVKALVVSERLADRFATRIVKGTKKNDFTTKLILDNAGETSFELSWDAQGRFIGGNLNGRKVRNVAEILRSV